jgi:N-acetylmuramoyl-L-alanine amidase
VFHLRICFFSLFFLPLWLFSFALPSGDVDYPPPKKIRPLIILDAGHGGSDEGTKQMSVQEKKLALTTALIVKQMLMEKGYSVILTRNRDVFISLARRVMIANQSKGKIFVSIHYNSAPNTQAQGIEIYYADQTDKERSRQSKKLAGYILRHILEQTKASSRGVRKANHYVTRNALMPAILIEGGFLSHPAEREKLKDPKYLRKLSKGIAEGVHSYIGLKDRPRRELNARPAA